MDREEERERERDLKRVPRARGERIIYAIKEGKRREYTRTCGTMAVTSFTSSELEDYQLQPRRSSFRGRQKKKKNLATDQIASRFVHRLFFF